MGKEIFAAALGGLQVGAKVAEISATNKAAKAQQRLQAIRTAQLRRAQIREARISRGRITNIAAQTGALGSSAILGAQGGLQTQLAVNLSFLDQTLGASQEISRQQDRAQTASAIGSALSVAASISGLQR